MLNGGSAQRAADIGSATLILLAVTALERFLLKDKDYQSIIQICTQIRIGW